MPRIFLAPYRFKIRSRDKGFDFIGFLQNNKGKHYKNEKDMIEFILKSVNVEGDHRVWGYFQHGKYGTVRPVVNVDTGRVTKKIQKRESPLDDYFYLIEYNKKSNAGFMILQRIGNIGVRSIFVQATYNWGVVVQAEPIVLGLKDLLKNPIMEIRIKIPKRPKDIDSRFEKIDILNDDDAYVEVSIKAKRNKILQFADKFKEALLNYDLKNIGYIYDENEETSVVVKVGESQRTINLTRGRVRTWVEVTNISKIKEEAEKLLTDIKTEGIGG